MPIDGRLRGLIATSAHVLRSIGRAALRRTTAMRLVARAAAAGGSLRMGSGVVVQHPELIQCGQRVAVADAVELLAGPSPGQSGPAIVLGSGVKIGRRSQLAASPGRIVIEAHASLHASTYLLGHVHVGRYSLLSANIFASSGDHHAFDTPNLPIRDQDLDARHTAAGAPQPVVIDEDCWIGWSVAIKRGVHIGRGAVIGANSVVTRDVPPYAVAAGQPARVIRSRLTLEPRLRIAANDEDGGPYLYRGFRQLRDERAHCAITYASHVWALRETVLLMARAAPHNALLLRGCTTSSGTSFRIDIEGRSITVALPAASHAAFSLHIALNELQAAPPLPHSLPAPALEGFSAIAITYIGGTANKQSAPADLDLCWAFESAELIA